MTDAPTDIERFPLLGEAGMAMLRRLREHPHAPRYNFGCGDRMTTEGLARVRAFAAALDRSANGWQHGQLPRWLPAMVERCRRDVPFYRDQPVWSDDFFRLPRVERSSIRKQPWSFVPDGMPLDDLIVYYTSGTAGDRMYMPSHPQAAARYLPLLEATLATHGVRLAGGGDRVSIVRVSAQLRTLTYPTVISYLDFAGFAKINLNLADWNDPQSPWRYLDDLEPEVYTSDPIALAELARLPLVKRSKAIVTSGTALLPGMKRALEGRFGCPVIDLYSLCEFGPVACSTPGGDGYPILPWEVYVEILDERGDPCPPGDRGEIVVTGALNPFLPLIRYRTGDFGAMRFGPAGPELFGLQGRPSVLFRGASGASHPSIDVSIALGDLPLPFLSLRQSADGAMLFKTRCDEDTLDRAGRALRGLFGQDQPLLVERVPDNVVWQGKPIQYASEMPELLPAATTPR